VLTVPQTAKILSRPAWLIRQLVDELGIASRAGLYRLIPDDKVDALRESLAQRDARLARREVASHA
jgi:hypothetical protein